MSVSHIKVELERMSAPEHARIQCHLRVLRWKDSPGLEHRLAVIHQAMSDGRKHSAEQAERSQQRFKR